MSQEQWRLLNKGELPQEGDEYCALKDDWLWVATNNVGVVQGYNLIYRRKIEQPKLVWSWTKPDKVGVWAYSSTKEDPNKSMIVIDLRSIDDERTDAWWCYLGPIPTIELPPKKYREPVLPQDHGKVCEFSFDADFSTARVGLLCGFNRLRSDDENPWRCADIGYYKFARIEVTE